MNLDKHYLTSHQEGIAVESPPPPATVANPPSMPVVGGYPMPPPTPEPKGFDRFVTNILLMRRSFPKAFLWWTVIVIIMTMLFTSDLFYWLVFH